MHTKSSAKPIPDGYHAVTPYIVASGVPRLIEFMKEAFGAVEKSRYAQPDGTVMHAEVVIRDSVVMLGDAGGPFPPMPCCLHLYVEDTDAAYRRALEAGATSVREPADQFYGDRSAGVRDPSGNLWWFSTHLEDVSPEEMERRQRAHSPERAGRS